MNPLGFAWRSLVRQPARAALGVLGVAAVGALLLDMLLLSNGLVLSMRDLLERSGWDVRVSAGDDPPGSRGSPRIEAVAGTLQALAALPSVHDAIAVRFADGTLENADGASTFVLMQGVTGSRHQAGPDVRPPWTLIRGTAATGVDEVVVNEAVAAALAIAPGASVTLRASCASGDEALPPVRVRITGVAEFPFQETGSGIAAASAEALARACGGPPEGAHMLLVASSGDAAAAAAAIRGARPDLTALTNADVVGRVEESGFTYFRQISGALTTVTLTFAVLLIMVLLTVSVNQRLGEIAALRALGFSRRRVAADVLSESVLIVGSGGLISIPLGLALAALLDRILKGMPGIPEALHFFVFEEKTLLVHAALLAATAIAAALYPIRVVTRLPIAATLRDEVME